MSATHIMGGDLTYKRLGGGKVEIRFFIYRDCSGTGLDGDIDYRIYPGTDVKKGTYSTFTSRNNIKLKDSLMVTPEFGFCKATSSKCVQRGLYIDTITLGGDTAGYHVTWFRNSRNNIITNLNPGSCLPNLFDRFGSVWYAFIPDSAIRNSTPQFLTRPIPYLCVSKTNVFNPLASDSDKDSLVFSLETPYSPGTGCTSAAFPFPFPKGHSNFSAVRYKTGYSVTNPFGGTSSISINSQTGEITALPKSSGFYVIAIQIKEYRVDPITKKVKYLGEIRRDLQFVVGNCTAGGKAPEFVTDTLGYTKYIKPGEKLCFDVFITDTLETDTLYIRGTGGIFAGPGATIDTPYATFPGDTAPLKAGAAFCWTPNCGQVTYTSPYVVTMLGSDKNCNQISKTYSIYVTPRALIKPPVIHCADILNDSTIKLSITDTTKAKSPDFKQYRIYRRKGSTGTFSLLAADTSYPLKSYTDTGVDRTDSITYSYYITIENTCSVEGMKSDTIHSIVIAKNQVSDKKVIFSWNAVGSKSRWYRVYSDEGGGYILRDSNQTRTYTVVSCSKDVSLKVQVADTTGCISNSRPSAIANLKDITAPYINTNIASASVRSYSDIRLTIRRSDSLDVKKYYIYRSVNNGVYTLLDSFNHSTGTQFYKYADKNSVDASQNTYSYKIKTVDTCGNLSGFGTEHTTVLLAVKKTFLKATLAWTKYKGFTWDTVEVQKLVSGKWTFLKRVANTDSTYADTPLSCKSNYYYRVIYRNSADTFYAISDTVFVPTADTVAPGEVNILSASVTSGTSVAVTFNKVPDLDIKRYEIYYKTGTGSYSLAGSLKATSAGSYTYNHTGIDPLTKTYFYQVKAVDSCDENKSPTSETHSPVQLTGTAKNLSNQLTWTKYQGFGVKNYKVYRWNSGWGSGLVTLAETDTSYLDTGLSCNVKRFYKIEAIENGGDNATSFSDSIALTPYDTIKPAKPEITFATVINGTSIDLFWKKSLSADVKDYEVSIKSSGTNWKILDTVQVLTYRAKNLITTDSTYSFRIRALDSCADNASANSDIHTTIQLGGKGQNLSNLLNWSSYQGFSTDKYLIYKWKSGAWQAVDSVNGSTTSYLHQPLPCNVPEIYKVVARDISGVYKSHSDSVKLTPYDTIKPPQPLINYATVVNGSTISLSWEESVSDVKEYEVSFKTSKGSWEIKDTVQTQTFVFTGLNTLDSTYSFRIRAIDSCANNTSVYSKVHTAIQLTGKGQNLSNLLTWSAYQGFSIHKYYILQLSGSTWNVIDSTDSSTAQYLHAPLSCNVGRIYKVAAVDTGGKFYTLSDSIKLTPSDTIKPAKPVIYYTTVVNDTAIYLTWNKSPAPDVKDYIVFRKTGTGSYAAIDTIRLDTQYVDKSVNLKTSSYTYRIQAYDTCANNQSAFSDAHNSILLTTKVTGCVQEIELSWNSYISWPGGVDAYTIYRSDNGGSETVLTTVSGTTTAYTDAAISYGNHYRYRIEAEQNGGGFFVSSSNTDSNMTFIPETPVLLSVSKLTTSAANGSLRLRWVSQKNSQHMSHHRVYHRLAGSGAAFALLADNIPVAKDTFIHSGINTQTADHEYYIETLDSCNSVAPVSGVHKSVDLTMQVGQLIHQLNWTPYEGFVVSHYEVEHLRGGAWVKVDSIPADTATTRFPAPCNYDIFYRIKAVSDEGITAYSDTAGGQALDTIPANAPVFQNAGVSANGQIQIDFQGGDSADIFGYAVLRSDNGGAYQTIGFVDFTTPADNYIGLDFTNTQTDIHCYTIATLDSCLNATFSDTFCAIQLRGTPMNQSARLSWHRFEGYELKQYELQELKGSSWQTIKTLALGDTTAFLDSMACYEDRVYRVKGSENGGTRITFSDTLHITPFDTIKPPAPRLHYVTAVPGQGIRLSWSWDRKSDVKYFDIIRKDPGSSSANYVATVTYDSTYLDKSVTDLNQAYEYFVIAIDSCNSSHLSPPSDTDRTMTLGATTLDCDPLARLQWTAYTELEKKVDAYAIFRSQGTGTPALVAVVSPVTFSYTDTAVQRDIPYCYYIAAVDSATGYYSASAAFCITPLVYPDPEPVELFYTTVTKTGASNGEMEIVWLPVKSTDIYAAGYHLYVANQPGGPFTLLHDEVDLGKTTYIHQNIDTRSTDFFYYVTPYNICAKEGPISGIHHPVNLDVQNNSLNAVLVWNRYKGFPVDHYEIEKSTDGSPMLTAYTVSAIDTIYSDTNVICGHVYKYRIRAVNNDGLISYSDSVTVTAFDNTPPRKADIHSATVFSTDALQGQIRLDFTGASDKNRKGYVIFRSVNGGPYSPIDTFNYTVTGPLQYIDNNLDTRGKTHAYYIRSLDSCGNLALPLDTHQAVLLDVTAQNAYNQLTWTHYRGFGSWRYIVERRSSGMPWKRIVVTANPYYEDYSVKCDTLYEYRVMTTELTGINTSLSNTDTTTAYEINKPLVPDVVRATVTATNTTAGTVNLSWIPSSSSDLRRYLIYRRSDTNPWLLVATLGPGITTHTDGGLNTYRKTYQYKILAEDSCGNISLDNSEIHRAVNLVATPANESIRLDWTDYIGFNVLRYEIYRDNVLIHTVDPMTLTFADTNLYCNQSYLYQVKAVAIDSTVSLSNTDFQKPFDTRPPKPVYLITATVSTPNNGITIQWTKSTSFDVQGYKVYRRNATGGGMVEVYQAADEDDTTFTDNFTLGADATCYYITATDACQNTSEMSNAGCVILLSGKAGNLVNTIDWTPYIDWPANVKSYNVYRKNDGGAWNLLQNVNGSTFTYTDTDLSELTKDFCYQVEAVENPGIFNAISKSTVICLNQLPIIYVPNVFTPGYSINLNDKFGPKGNYIDRFEMQIYNRWGERVFESSDTKPWDGMIRGRLAPEGVYVYKMTVYGFDGKPQHFDGTVTILW